MLQMADFSSQIKLFGWNCFDSVFILLDFSVVCVSTKMPFKSSIRTRIVDKVIKTNDDKSSEYKISLNFEFDLI